MKNKNGFYLGAIITLSIILVGIIALIIILNRKPNEVIDNKDNENDRVEISRYNYDDKIDKDLKDIAVLFDKKYNDYQLLNINSFNDKIEDFDKLSNEEKLDLVGNYFDYYRDIDGYTGKTFDDKLTSEDFNDYFKKVFGKELSFENKDLLCDNYNDTNHCHVYYDEPENIFTYNKDSMEHQRGLTLEYYSKLVDAKKDDDIYTLTYVKVFGKLENGLMSDFYDKYNFDTLKDNKVASNKTDVDGYEPLQLISDTFTNITNYDKYTKYQYQVKMEDNEVYLVGYQVLEK